MMDNNKTSWPFDAQTATMRSKSAGMIIAKEEIEKIGELVMDACSRGVYQVRYPGPLSQQALDFLEDKGYCLKTFDFGKSYDIRWPKK